MADRHDTNTSYRRFFLMIGAASVAMFLLMYTHSYQVFDHAWFSETRLFMTLLMAGSMMVIMLGFMLDMYPNRKANALVFLGAGLLMVLAVVLVRSQVTVDDVDYMAGMIPHHSIAVLTSERAQIDDVRVRELAEEILRAQRREIKEMEWLIRDIRDHGVAATRADAAARPVPTFAPTPE